MSTKFNNGKGETLDDRMPRLTDNAKKEPKKEAKPKKDKKGQKK